MSNLESERKISTERGNSLGMIEHIPTELDHDTLSDLAHTLVNDSTVIVASFTYKDGETKDILGSQLEEARKLEGDIYERFLDGVIDQFTRAARVKIWKPAEPNNYFTGKTGEEIQKLLGTLNLIDSI